MSNNKYQELFLTTTDTVTGLGAPISKDNYDAMVDIKGRNTKKPFIVMIGSLEQAREFKEWTSKAEKMAKQFWPGDVTLVLSKKVALRLPNLEPLRKLILDLGPVYMTSANFSGGPVLSLEEAKKAFPQIKNIYDFGMGSGKPSKIIDVKSGKILRR